MMKLYCNLAFWFLTIVCNLALAADRPNVILILADDLGAKEVGCYGNKEHRTPNIDRMAADGARFETFYAMPLCTPTRVAIMTGQYGFHNGFLGMQNAAFKPPKASPLASIVISTTVASCATSVGCFKSPRKPRSKMLARSSLTAAPVAMGLVTRTSPIQLTRK